MWKGDYFNLGAGAETGIYYGKEGNYHWNSVDYTNLGMSMTVYDKNMGEKIFIIIQVIISGGLLVLIRSIRIMLMKI